MCNETSCVATFGEFGVEALKSAGSIAFVKFTCRQSPTFARRTRGRGRLPGRSCQVFGTRSLFSAKTNAFGIVAPRRLSIIAFGMATTSAVIVRVHCCIGAGFAAAVVVAVVGGEAGVAPAGAVTGDVASVLAGSVCGLAGSVAGLVFSSVAGAATFAAGFGSEELNSATGLSTAAAGVCAPATTALTKQRVITVNEATMFAGVDLEPSMFTSPLHYELARLRLI